jgi:hypothetical protein
MIENTYKESRPLFRTFDLVLFSGRGLVSSGIQLASRSKWSHVGFIIYVQVLGTYMLWESTLLHNIKDAEDGIEKQGVQLVPLSERVNSYNGEVAVRQIKGIHWTEEKMNLMLVQLSIFRSEMKNRPYEQNMIELVKSAYDGRFGENKEDLSSVFCSELVAEAYQRVGLLSEDKPSNEYTPADFSSGKNIKLLSGSLSNEIYLKKVVS